MRVAAWILFATAAFLPEVWGQPFAQMPGELQVRWRCSTQVAPGWNATGFEARAWSAPCFEVPGWYPEWMEPERQALHRFMWTPPPAVVGRPVYFRRSVRFSGQVGQARANVCADDEFALYVNGRSVGRGRQAHRDATFEFADLLQTGENVVALQARDTKPPGYGLLVVPEVTQSWPMAAGWRATAGREWASSVVPGPAPGATRRARDTGGCARWPAAGPGWQQPGFDAGRWSPAAPDTAPAIKLQGLEPFACISLPGGMREFSEACFRRTVYLDGYPLEGEIVILADDSYELYVNGHLASLEKRVDRAYVPRQVNVTPLLRPGANVIAVKVTNDWGPGRLYCVPTITMTF